MQRAKNIKTNSTDEF